MISLCSGGFSILHSGHIDYLEGARQYGQVVIALNSDAWLKRKYGFVVMPWSERARILKSLIVVYDVIRVQDDDGTVCEAIRSIQPNYFVNGGDRTEPEPREHAACVSFGVIEIFRAGGKKVNSSSNIIREIKNWS